MLFNEFGAGNVTMRKLALSLGMSVGNLNYHFGKKSELISYIFHEFEGDELAFLGAYMRADLDRKALGALINQHAYTVAEYRFLWLDLHHLKQHAPIVVEGLKRISIKRKQMLDSDLALYLNGFCFDMELNRKPFNTYQIKLNAAPLINAL